jgi:hypothetical protein
MKCGLLAIMLLTSALAQDNKKKPEEQKTSWESDQYGFAIKKAGKRPKDWDFEFDNLQKDAILRIRHKNVMAMIITFFCYPNPEGRDVKIDDQAKSFDDNLAKQPKVKLDKREKIKMVTGEDAIQWKLSTTDEKTNDDYEVRVWLWFSSVNKNLYHIEAVVKKGEWERYGKDITEIINTIRTYKKK